MNNFMVLLWAFPFSNLMWHLYGGSWAKSYSYRTQAKVSYPCGLQASFQTLGSDTLCQRVFRKLSRELIVQRFSRAGPRGRAREWATLGVHPLSWLLSNNRLEEVCGTLTKGTFSSRLLLSNQDKRCTPSVAHSLPLPLPPGFCSTCQISMVWMSTLHLHLSRDKFLSPQRQNW